MIEKLEIAALILFVGVPLVVTTGMLVSGLLAGVEETKRDKDARNEENERFDRV